MFPYYGDIKGLHQTLSSHRQALKRAYRSVLGKQLYERLQLADETQLCEGSFTAADAAVHSEYQTRSTTNKFFIATVVRSDDSLRPEPDGSLRLESVDIAPGFILTEVAFERTAHLYQGYLPTYLGPYIHEYSHFALMAIQDLPMILVANLLISIVGATRMPPRPADINGLVEAYEGTLEEKRLAAMLCVFGVRSVENYESFTNYLETCIHHQLGYSSPPGYYDPGVRQFISFDVPAAEMSYDFPVGCFLPTIPKEKRMKVIAYWNQHQGSGNRFQANFLASLTGLPIKMLTLPELMAACDAENEDATAPP
jgi:hypothetical protein